MSATARKSTYTHPPPPNDTCPILIFFKKIILTIIIGRLVFTHTIDSHNNFNVSDPCPFIPLPNGDDIETGAMPRPDKLGAPVTKYEEVWRYHSLRDDPEPRRAWILESADCEQKEGQYLIWKTFLGRIGNTYLALHQEQVHVQSRLSAGKWKVEVKGGLVSARREEWSGTQWEEKYVLGPSGQSLPSMRIGIDGKMQGSWTSPGQKVSVGGRQYILRALEVLENEGSSGKSRL